MSKIESVYETIKTVTGYKTSDDRIFEKLESAEEWQHYLDYKEKLYNIFDSIFDDYLEEYCKDDLPFNDSYLKETLTFMVANLDLNNLIIKLTEVRDADKR